MSTNKSPRRIRLSRGGAWFAALALLMLAPISLSSQTTIGDLRSEADRWLSDAREIYRFDEEDRRQIWDAYCAKLDPQSDAKSVQFATEIAHQLQQDQLNRFNPEMDKLKELLAAANRLASNDADKAQAQEILSSLQREQTRLDDLRNGVVLQGSNHPFTQHALAYGIERHNRLCESEGVEPKVCNKSWPGISGRPDLVFVNGDGLWVYEFKPNNDAAIGMGYRQIADQGYIGAVESYYQQFFPHGKESASEGTPDSDHGGSAILAALSKEPKAWTSDGLKIRAQPKVFPYEMCEQRF